MLLNIGCGGRAAWKSLEVRSPRINRENPPMDSCCSSQAMRKMGGLLRRVGLAFLLFMQAPCLAQQGSSPSEVFDPDLFQSPPTRFYPSAFWAPSSGITPQEAHSYLTDLKNQKLMMLSLTSELSYHLSPAFFQMYRTILQEGKQLGMEAWLTDDAGYPSGAAGGQVLKDHPEYGEEMLIAERHPVALREQVKTPPGAVAAFKDGAGTLVVCRVVRSNRIPDHLSSTVTQRFIELTHQAFRRELPDDLWSMLFSTYTDEPAVSPYVQGKQLPWTATLPAVFRRAKGYDIDRILPLLLSENSPHTPEAAQAKIDYFDVWSQMYVDNFMKPLRDWCRANRFRFGGHLDHDDTDTGAINDAGSGDILRSLRTMDVPGVDTIWRQIFPGQRNHYFPRFASSAAHQMNNPYAFSESFAVYGFGLTVAERKWITDYQYVRGLNVMIILGYEPQADPQHDASGDPQRPFYPLLHQYIARLGYALSLGTSANSVALYFPVRDFWAAAGQDVTPESTALDDTALELERHQVDFDLVDDDLIVPGSVQDGAIHAGKMSYRTLVVSRTRAMKDDTADELARFVRQGGTLILIDELPQTGPLPPHSFLEHCNLARPEFGQITRVGKGSIVLTKLEDLPRWLPPSVTLLPAANSLRVSQRQLWDGSLFFITNEAYAWRAFTLQVNVPGTLKLLDPETGEVHLAPKTIRLAPWGSVLLLADSRTHAMAEALEPNEKPAVMISGDWQVRRLTRATIASGKRSDLGHKQHETANLLVPIADDPWRPARLEDLKFLLGNDFSGTAEYRLEFQESPQVGRKYVIDLGDVATIAEVSLNGNSLGVRAWPPYRFATGKALKPGTNELRIRVTNTLANFMVSPAMMQQVLNPQGLSDEIADADRFMREFALRDYSFDIQSTRGGLFGPVRLLSLEPAAQR